MTNETTDKKKGLSVKELTRIGLCAAIICILGPISFPIPISPIPVTLSIFAIYLALVVLGMKEGTISILIYILLGAIGLPVFSGFTGGIGKVLGPTGGYIIGYIPLALIGGFFITKFKRNIPLMIVGLVLGTLTCYALGTLWLMHQAGMDLGAALTAAVIPYIPFDLGKMAAAILIGLPVNKAIKRFQ